MFGAATSVWIVVGILTAALLALLLPTLLRTRRHDDHAYDVAIYRDQLSEVLRDRERGLLGEDEAGAAQREIERRLLAADAASRGHSRAAAPPRRVLAAVIAVALPALAVPIYLQLGSPGVPDQPLSARAPAVPDGDTAQAIEALAARLAERPDDAQGWAQLGRELMIARRYDDAVAALERATTQSEPDPATVSLYGEALVLAADGFVTEGARGVFNSVLADNPADPRARFYMALGSYQSGRREQALADWLALAADSPADAPWMQEVEARIRNLAVELGRDPDTVLAQLPRRPAAPATAAVRGPSAADVAAMGRLTPEERAVRINAMVDGLEARLADQPDDLEGWRMLGRARLNLGDPTAAAAAFGAASRLAPERVDVLLDWGMAVVAAADGARHAGGAGARPARPRDRAREPGRPLDVRRRRPAGRRPRGRHRALAATVGVAAGGRSRAGHHSARHRGGNHPIAGLSVSLTRARPPHRRAVQTPHYSSVRNPGYTRLKWGIL